MGTSLIKVPWRHFLPAVIPATMRHSPLSSVCLILWQPEFMMQHANLASLFLENCQLLHKMNHLSAVYFHLHCLQFKFIWRKSERKLSRYCFKVLNQDISDIVLMWTEILFYMTPYQHMNRLYNVQNYIRRIRNFYPSETCAAGRTPKKSPGFIRRRLFS